MVKYIIIFISDESFCSQSPGAGSSVSGFLKQTATRYGKDKPIKAVHFPGKKKPWTKPIGHLEHYVKYAFRRQWMLFKIFLEYDRLLIKANLSLLKR